MYAAGCRNIQFDDCTWGMIGDPNYQNFLKESNTKVEDVAAEYLRLNNLALENRPEGLTITTHVCRGNYHSTWASEGDYFTVAPFLLAQENVDAFYLEFDDARSGSFEPLKYVADGKKWCWVLSPPNLPDWKIRIPSSPAFMRQRSTFLSTVSASARSAALHPVRSAIS